VTGVETSARRVSSVEVGWRSVAGGDFPLGFVLVVIIVICESRVRKVTSAYSGLYMEIDRFRLLGYLHALN